MTFQESSFLAGECNWSLVVDTSRLEGSLTVLSEEGKQLKKISWGKEQRHTTVLLKNFKLLLVSFKKNKLKKIFFIQGPGSFTGLRIGAAFVKTVSYSLGSIPIVCVSSFLEDAQNVISQKSDLTDFTILIPSIKNKVFSSHFKLNNGKWRENINMNGAVDLITPIVKCFSSHHQVTENYSDVTLLKPLDESLEKALSVESTISYYIKKNTYLDLYPLYLRQSEAEEKFRYDKTKLQPT